MYIMEPKDLRAVKRPSSRVSGMNSVTITACAATMQNDIIAVASRGS